jgi:parallel beta-helix repeat protein
MTNLVVAADDRRESTVPRSAAQRVVLAGTVAVIVAILFVGAGGFVGVASAAEDVDSCRVINESGGYTLTTNLTQVDDAERVGTGSDGTCIDIRASDIVFDGNGHLIDSVQPSFNGYSTGIKGIEVDGEERRRRNVTVRNVTLTDWETGIRTFNATDVTVEHVNVSHLNGTWTRKDFMAIQLYRTSNSTVRDSNLEKHIHGISAGYRSGEPHSNNRYVRNQIQEVGVGISLHRGAGNTVANNTIRPDASGIEVINDDPRVANNTVVGGINDGITVVGQDVTVVDNTIQDMSNNRSNGENEYAIDVEGQDQVIRRNTVENNDRGIQVAGEGHLLRDNTIQGNDENFHLARRNQDHFTETSFDTLDIDTSNTVGGEPIYYRFGVSGISFTSADAPGYLALINSSDVTVRGVTLQNNTDGVYLYNVTNVTIADATIEKNAFGVDADGGRNVTLSGNDIVDNTLSGVAVTSRSPAAANYTVEANRISKNGETPSRSTGSVRNVGVFYEASNATFADNTLSNNSNGIVVKAENDSRSIQLLDNNVSNSSGVGLFVSGWGSTEGGEVIRRNEVTGSGDSGIVVSGSGAPVLDNVVQNNGDAGIWILTRDRPNRIRGTTATGNQYGIRLGFDLRGDPVASDDNMVVGNRVTNNTYGVHVGERSQNNTMTRNNASGNRYGVYLDRTGNNHVLANEVSTNERDGVYLTGYRGDVTKDMSTFVIGNNTAVANGEDGIELTSARATTDGESGPFEVVDNDVRSNGDNGIWIARSTAVTVADNGNVSDNGAAGIRVGRSEATTVRNHTTANNTDGVVLWGNDGSAPVTLEDHRADGNADEGVFVSSSTTVEVASTVSADGNDDVGVLVFESETTEVRGVTATNNTAGFAVEASDNVTLQDVTARRNGVGVYLAGGNDVEVRDGTVVDGSDTVADFSNSTSVPDDLNVSGFVVETGSARPENVSIVGNTIDNHRLVRERSTEGYGVDVRAPTRGVDIAENTITGTHIGVRLVDGETGAVVVDGNAIRRNDVGIAFGRAYPTSAASKDNRITSNEITDNPTAFRLLTFDQTRTGGTPSAEDYAIYNNFVNASSPFEVSTGAEADAIGYLRFSRHLIVQERTTSHENPLDGAMIGGNAWLKPDGTGFSQTCSDADADGLCDSPYYLIDYDGTNFDTCEDVDGDDLNDTDGDGLCDNWEDARRVDSAPLTNESVRTGASPPPDPNPGPKIDLIAMGASLDHKDLFLEIDYMKNATHSHRPDPAAVDDVVDSFADAPVENPSGNEGIDLHVVVDDEVPENQYLSLHGGNDAVSPNATFSDLRTGDNDAPCGGVNGTAAERNTDNCEELLATREKAFHYTMSIHRYTHNPGSSGLSWSRFFIVADGAGPGRSTLSTGEQAGTLMHEFGHQLGLPHGGSDGINKKPNYLSIMSYTYQLPYKWPRRPVDYSDEKIRSLNESALDESRGLETSRDWRIFYNSSDDDRITWTDGTPIDWNGNGEIDSGTVKQDIEGFNRTKNNSFEVLEGHDDWANLNLVPAKSTAGGGVTIPVDETAEKEPVEDLREEAAEIDLDDDSVPNLEDNCPATPNPDQADGDDDGVGDACDPGDIDLVSDLDGPRTHGNGSVEYTATMSHDGADPATTVTLTVDVPASVRVESVASPGDCTTTAGTLSCEFGTVDPGDSLTTTIEGTVLVNETYSVTASARANETDSWPGDNDATRRTYAGEPTPDPAVASEPSTVDFGNVSVGDSTRRAVTVANNGTGALEVTDLSVTGADAANFSETASEPFALAPGEARDIVVSYEPTAERSDTAALEIQHNDTDRSTIAVGLSGNGTEATGAAVYANEEGVIDTDGLRQAINDWRSGAIGTDLLREVIDYWRSGEKVE